MPAHRRRTKRKTLIQLVSGLMALTLVGGIVAGYYKYQALQENISTVDFAPEDEADPRPVVQEEFAGALNVLVMGSDTRAGTNGEGIGSADGTPGLSDTTILLHISEDRSFAYGVSLPRDAMVERPACPTKGGGEDVGGLSQFNEAYAVGGPACTVKTVESLTNIRINHFAVVDFSGFKDIVDAVDGVNMCVPAEINDSIGNIYLPAGTYSMDGKQALDYVRVRHGVGVELGDIGRMKRQQAFLSALIAKVKSAETFTSPDRALGVLEASTDALTTDPGFADLAKLASLGQDVAAIGPSNITFVTVPFELWAQDENRVVWRPEADALWERIRTDQPLTKDFMNEAIKGPRKNKNPGTGRSLDTDAYGLCA